MPLVFSEEAGDGCQTPVLVRLVELGCVDVKGVERALQFLELSFVSGSKVDVRRMVVDRTTVEIRVLDGSMASLHGLLREWDIAARDGIKVGFALHDSSRLVTNFCSAASLFPQFYAAPDTADKWRLLLNQ